MRPLFVSLLLLAALFVNAQCTNRSFILSPAVGKTLGQGLSVNLEAGYLPYLSKSYASLKSSFWSVPKTVLYTDSKGDQVNINTTASAAFVGLNYGYVPQAFEDQPRKWVLGGAAGLLLNEGQRSRPAAQFSAAYTLRMNAGNYSSGLGCLKLEGTCMVSSLGVKPGLSAGVFLVM